MSTPVRQFSQASWDLLLDETIKSIRALSVIKGGEYSRDLDCLANFRRNAEATDSTPEQIWRIYAGKHWDSITQWIKDRNSGVTRPRAESMLGRADDLIVYSILLKAMMIEAEVEDKAKPSLELALNLQKNELTCDHQWHRFDRHTDTCVFCNSMREHRSTR